MWNWITALVMIFAVLLLIEELSHFIWSRYLSNPTEKKSSRFSDFKAKAREFRRKYMKNPSH